MAIREVVLDGSSLTREDVVAIAREGASVAPSDDALERVRAARNTVERSMAAGAPIYGLTTGVGVRKRNHVNGSELARSHERLLGEHRVAQGAPVAPDVVRASLVCLANSFLRGYSGVRAEVVHRLLAALWADEPPHVRRYGSTGVGDLGPLADLAAAVLPPLALEPGEAFAVITNNAVSTGHAALTVADAARLLDTLGTAAALDLVAFGANRSPLHHAVDAARPHPGLVHELGRLRAMLAGGDGDGEPRHLQDPLSFRGAAAILGAARGALDHVDATLSIELNAAQHNTLVIVEEGRVISAAMYEILPLAAGLDYLRIALAPALTAANERLLKLLQAPHSGLTDGLAAPGFEHEAALSELAWPAQELAVEARLLAQPVSVEIPSATQAEGIEDRGSFAPLAARRLAQQVELGERLVAIGFAVAAQAVELRHGRDPATIGPPLRAVLAAVRSVVPFTGPGQAPPPVEPLVELVRAGGLRRSPVLV
jgi:histidine ammonia-lyase